MAVDITKLPPPPPASGSGIDVTQLPPPPVAATTQGGPGSDISSLPPPPRAPESHETPDWVDDTAITKIAEEHGVNADELKAMAPYYGVKSYTVGEKPSLAKSAEFGAKYTAGFVGRAALGVPQFVYKKLQDGPMRRAIDDLTALGSEQRSTAESLSEMAAIPFAGPVGATEKTAATGAKAVAKRLAHTTAVGAGIGAVNAPEGQELQGAIHGAEFGGALGAGGEVLGKVLRTTVGPAAYRNAELKLQQETDQLAARTAESEKLLEDSVLRGRPFAAGEVDRIVEEQIPTEVQKELMDPHTEIHDAVASALKEQGREISSELMKQGLADQVAEQRAQQFAEKLTGEHVPAAEARDAIQEFASRQGPEAVAQKYQDFLTKQRALRVIDEQGSRITGKTGAAGKLANFFSGNQFVLRHLDDKFGLGGNLSAEQALSKATANSNQSGYALVHFRSMLDDIDREAGKLGVRGSPNIYQALDTGKMEGLSPGEQKVTGMFKDYFQKLLDFSNGKQGLPDGVAALRIPQRENYVPHSLMDANDVVIQANKKMQSALEGASKQLGRPIQDISQLSPQEFRAVSASVPEIGELKQGIELFSGQPTEKPAEFSATFKDRFSTRQGLAAIATKAGAALERNEAIPEWMMERDPFKLAAKSTRSNIKHIFMRRSMDQLNNIADVMDKAGGAYEGRYVRRIAEDFMGTRPDTVGAFTNQARVDFVRKMDSMIQKVGADTVQGKTLEAAKAVPDIMANWARSIYPNVLGYRLRPLMLHTTQAATKLWPELGTTPWSSYAVLRGAVKAALDTPGLLKRGEELGTVTSENLMQRSAALRTGMERSAIYRIPADIVNGIGNAGMFAFEKLVRFNRALAIGTADTMAADLVAGSQGASKALRGFPQSIRNAVETAGTQQEKSDVLAKYLNSTTMYNYDKLNKSEFGRTMGPMFSAFSTWPTNTLGDIVYEMRSRGVTGSIPRNMEKYVAPWALLYMVDKGIRSQSHGELTDREKAIFGAGGIQTMAPIGSLGALAKGEALTPPMYTAVMETIIHPMLGGDMDKGKSKAYKGLANSLAEYGPDAGLVQFVTDQLPTLLTGHRPEGNNFIDRTQEGARIMEKKLK